MSKQYFKPEVVIWSKLLMHSEKAPKSRRKANISTSYRKMMSRSPFSVRYLRPEVELMYLLCMRRHYHH